VKKYVENLLKKFKMDNCKIVATPLVVNEKLLKEDGAEKTNASIQEACLAVTISHCYKARHPISKKSTITFCVEFEPNSFWSS